MVTSTGYLYEFDLYLARKKKVEGNLGKNVVTARKTIFPKFWNIIESSKDQVNIIFPSTFWLKRDRISHHRKVQNKNSSVISKYHLSINVLLKERLQNYMESKNEGNKNKIFGEFNCTMEKMDKYYGNKKHKDFIDGLPIMLSLWIMD